MEMMERRDWMKAAAVGLAAVGAGCAVAPSANEQPAGEGFAAVFAPDWDLKRGYALAVAEAMPADKYDLKPTPEMRSFGELMAHISGAAYLMAATAAGDDDAIKAASQPPEGTDKETIVASMKTAFDYTGEAIPKVTDAVAGESVDVFDGYFTMTRSKLCQFMRDHTTHHLGYAIPYLRMGGVTEVPAYSFTGANPSPV